MDVGAQPFSRLAGLSLSVEGFRRLAVANVVMLIVIIGTGATVRLTGSGLGCEHWPGCQAHHFDPRSYHGTIEFSNRVVAFLTILTTLVTLVFARGHRRLAGVIFVGTLAQAPLGAITIHYHLNPWLVLSHFLLSLVVLGLAVVLAAGAWPRERPRLPWWVPRAGTLVWLSACVLVFSGMLATASGKYPGSSGGTIVRRVWAFEPAVYWHVRATAVFGVSFALLLAWLVRNRAPQVRGALVLLGLLAVQMTIGEVQYRTSLPWWLVLAHVTTAAMVWAAATAFVFSLWRPRKLG
ncbi:MAG TPA: COX15/CtaA family protein [Gaiellaceae bacterium]|nr:COX15/CtaA family protein [Gaiellaceae bacterium]